MWRELMIPRALSLPLSLCVCACACSMPGHRAGWHASVENSHLNCRSCSCARPSPRDCSRLIDSSKQREQLRHGTVSEPGATERKIFPTPSFDSVSAHGETNYSVPPRTRLTPCDDVLDDPGKLAVPVRHSALVHGERNTSDKVRSTRPAFRDYELRQFLLFLLDRVVNNFPSIVDSTVHYMPPLKYDTSKLVVWVLHGLIVSERRKQTA